jgi:hypothetical protein
MEERPPIWRAAANILNKQLRIAEEGWSSSLGVGRGANNSSPWKTKCYVIFTSEMNPLEAKESGGELLSQSVHPEGSVSRGGVMQQENEKIHTTLTVLRVKCRLLLSDFNETWILSIDFGNIIKYEIS